jgi:GxxExxY protein
MEDNEVTSIIIGSAMKVHTALGPGFLESVYEHALAHELRKAGLGVTCQAPIEVRYDSIVVGNFIADMWVEHRVLVEIKACKALALAHEVQLIHYLVATGVDSGLLLNFGADSLQIKRKYRIYKPGQAAVAPEQTCAG